MWTIYFTGTLRTTMSSWVYIAICCAVLVLKVQGTYDDAEPCSECGDTSSSTAEAIAVATATPTESAAVASASATSTGPASTATAGATSTATSETTDEKCLRCGKNEVEACVKSCPPEKTCKNRFIMYSCINDPQPCTKKCICAEGYYRNSIGECIPAAQCEPQSLNCGPHQVEQCVKRCPPEKTCRNLNLAVRCAQDDRPCTKKCVCEEGYVKNAIGQCIIKALCDKCKKPNEFYACDSACDNECINIDSQNRTNCPIKNIKCNEKCYCDDGYARDGDGNCIPVDQCKRCGDCGVNEEKRCVPSCPPEKTCRNRNIMYKCQGNLPCTTKCVCKKGYFRNANGQCITEAQCDKCKKPNEFYACDSACDNECINIDSQNRTNCPIKNIKCNEKCYCDDGYARDGDGNCIPVDQCKRCGVNEEQRCVPSCPPERTCRNQNIKYKCQGNLPCTTKCVCKKGHFRNVNGQCITKAQCDKCKKPNEFYECGGACDNECINIDSQNRTHCPIVNIKCNEKCYCDDGYARDADGNCIPIEKCKPQSLNCGPHEVEQCVKRCPPEKTCRNLNLAVRCAQDDRPCTKKCVCEEGYVKNAIGQCIIKALCDKCKKPNEFYACDSACDNECINIDSQNRTNCPIKNIKCNEKCYCDDGYARDGDGNCIPVDQCKRCGDCGVNEEQRCVPSCPPERTCRNRNIMYKCQGNLPCTTKCVCKKGYFRNANGQCITEAQCDKCKKPNEFYECGGACDNECINIDSQNRTHCPIVNIKCNEKCYCDDGYARDADGNCIPIEKCKPTLQCGPHEVEKCVKRCPPQKTCRNQNLAVRCAQDNRPCTKKCVCEEGYLRNALGQCITKAQCDKCKKRNEFYSCDSACDNECINIDSQNRTNCPIKNIKCNEKCYCDDGYARDGDGNCIPVDQCKRCGVNEEQRCVPSCPPERTCRNRNIMYKCQGNLPCTTKCVCKKGYFRNVNGQCITEAQCDKCKKPNEFYECGGACDNECINIDSQNRTHCPIVNIKCNEKCYCDDGYARDADGNCIPIEKCKPTLQCGPHEVEKCVKRCPPQKTCRNQNLAVRCAQDNRPCTKQCVCEKGYLRNALGQCITKAQCDKCKKRNEFYACDSACDNECINIDSQNRTNCPIVNIKCNEKCYCDDGYARDADGNCIPVDQCKRCGPNEEQQCVPSCPPERTCRNRNIKYRCQGNLPCTTKCVCKKGYFRNANGQCITEAQCERCGPNEVQRCVPSCPPEGTCRNRDIAYLCESNLPCTTKCVCAEGYYRNSIGECITGQQCDQCNKTHEFYSCGSACDTECHNIDSQNRTNCPIINIKCNEMCYCDDGYARDGNGKCVPADLCKKCSCKKNEVYVQEKRTCPPEICRSIVSKYDCSKAPPPKPGCACKSGYLRRNETSPCIPICQCPEIASTPECQKENCKDPNEEFVQEKITCPPDTCEALTAKYDCCKEPPPQPGCTCKSGYRRLKNKCVPICKCPQIKNSPECQNKTCGLNEEYVKEKRTCPPETCRSIVSKYDCSKAPPPKPGCACKSGYLRRNETSPCIPICQCPEIASTPECQKENCKDPNEEFVQEKITCPPDTCEALTAKYDCSKEPPPQPGCTCKSGYRRLKNKCVPICKCPQIKNSPECQNKTCGLNEEYVKEKRTCPPEICRSIVSKYDCSKAPPPKPGCACKSGYLRRNETSPCIPICQCPEIASTPECQKENCKDPNEEFVQEKMTCPPDTCKALTARYDCSKEPPPQPGCTCKSGYRRLEDKCVPICKCPEMAHSPECQNKTCGLNEEYVKEKRTCPPEICRSIVADYDCRNAPPPKPGCACKSGYLRRNETSPCIPTCQCPEIASTPECQKENCKDPNEEFVQEKITCPPDTCKALTAKYDCSKEPPPQPGCTCKSGYRRLEDKCVPICKCPEMANSPECLNKTCKDPNEEYVQEKSTCPDDTCKALVEKKDCSNAPKPQPGCQCIDGYRRLNDKCVPICECPEMASTAQCQTSCSCEDEDYYYDDYSTLQ